MPPMSGPSKIFLCLLCLCLWAKPAFGEGGRSAPVDWYLIFDGSSPEAAEWICAQVVEKLFQPGDFCVLWDAGEKAAEIFTGEVTGSAETDALKAALRGQTGALEKKEKKEKKGKKDFAGALKKAEARQKAAAAGRIPYVLMVSGSAAGDAPWDAQTAALLRYSRVEEYSRWKVLTVALGIDRQVRAAASALLEGR